MRGNHPGAPAIAARRGSIPACAGEPGSSTWTAGWTRVYPRVCGGTSVERALNEATVGLSPRVRGNPSSNGWIYRKVRVYPRVCGGTSSSPVDISTGWGLSPRVRGDPSAGSALVTAGRSIPACAGEPRKLWLPRGPLWVYPRVCGGTARKKVTGVSLGGLSPRVRGNRARLDVEQVPDRSIPACAGEPRPTGGDRPDGGVYPRVCGGTPHRFRPQ